ncbi:uncharacterized protein LOC105198207 isoform X2 [Solenopsis invicta]|uniref:uncharacterized protein LOC105198207 isoform X2 n=1 Tax=Solenopsis invicta TaxID=13686 RepID=UPI00193CE3B0|nr:uncharacterized protein LOC105198207 isoform X2 [Solenopsis invicta]
MAKRKSINRGLRRSPRHRSSDSMNSALLDPDTDIVGEGRTFWWNNLEESTPPRYSRLYSKNETAKQLNENSQIDSTQSPPEWWKNLETSNSKHAASTKHNFSAGIVKRNILQISTSESEKESERSLKKVQLKATKRKSINNAFLKALDDTETAVNTIETNSLNLSSPNIEKAMSNANEIVVSSHASDESIEMTSGKYLKPKSRFIQRARKSIGKNAFADVLADNSSSFVFDPNKENDNNEAPLMSRLASLSPSKRSINRSNNITNKSSPIHKSPRLSSDVTKRQSLDLQAGDDSNTDSSGSFLNNNKSRRKRLFEATALTPKSKLLQDSRKSVTKKPNLFEEILEENDNITARESNVSAEDNHASFKEDKSEIKIVDVRGAVEMEVSPPRDSRAASEEKSDDISLTSSSVAIQLLHVQAEGNVEANSSGSSLDNNKSRKKRFFEASSLTPKSRLSQNSRKSITKKPNLFEEILEENSNISARKSHIPIEDNHTSFKRDESIIRIANVSRSEEMEKSPQMKGNRTTNKNKSDDISLTLSSDQDKRSKSKELNVSFKHRNTQATNNNLANLSKSISQKNTVIKTPEKQASFSRKSTRKETLEEHAHTNTILPVGSTNINETIRHETASDHVHDDVDIERDLPKQMSKSSPMKELRVLLTRSLADNFPKNLSETPKTANVVREVVDNLHNNTNKDSSIPKKMSKSSPDKEARLTHNSSRNQFETPKRPSQDMHKRLLKSVGDIEEDDVNVDSDINIGSVSQIMSSTRISKVGTNVGTRKSTGLRLEMESSNDEDAERARQTIQQNSTLLEAGTSSKTINRQNSNRTSIREGREIARKVETSLGTRKSISLRLEMESSDDEDAESARQTIQQDSTLMEAGTSSKTINQQSIQNSNGTSIREDREIARKVGTSVGTRKSTSLRLEMESSDDEDAEPARQTIQQDSTSVEAGTSSNTINQQSIQNSNGTSIREDREIARKVGTSVGTRKSTSLRLEMESSDDEDAEPARQTIQQDSTSVEAGTSSNTINRQSIQNSNRTSIREDREIARKVGTSVGTREGTSLRLEMESSDDEDAEPARQTIQQDSTSVEAGTSSNTINRQSIQNSNRTGIRESREIARKQKSNSFKSLRKIDDFFKVKQTPTTLEQSNGREQKSQVFEKMEKIKTELEKIKTREMAAMHIVTDKKKFPLKKKDMKSVENLKQATKVKPLVNHTKVVNKAFLVNGKVYRAPRLPRPKYWATDRLYKFLWNHMEPNYKLATRVKSEKFVQGLAKTVAIIERRKNYETYKAEVNALMKEMARLNIINTRNDFYHFCQEFMPYEFRVKVVPMLMPGNKNNIPYNSELLHIPLLDVTHEE